MFPENTNTVVDKERDGGGLTGTEQQERERGGENRGDESRWKGRKHEAGMTSLGLTFHSRPTPALCILTSLRCVSYILYLPCDPSPLSLLPPLVARSLPIASLLRVPLPGTVLSRREKKNKKKEKTERFGDMMSKPSNPRLAEPRGCWSLVSSRFRQQM